MGKHHHLQPMTMEPTTEQLAEWLSIATMTPDSLPHPSVIACDVARLAYQAGADAELEACVEWIRGIGLISELIPHLYAERRPKPPSLKQQAMEALDALIGTELRGDNPHVEMLVYFLNSLPDD